MKKKIYTALLFAIFIVSLLVLAGHIFSDFKNVLAVKTNSTEISQNSKYKKIKNISLGNVEVHNFKRMGFNTGYIKFSPDNKYLAVGTENGLVMVFNQQGEKVWQKQLGLGKITALDFARDGQNIYVGETSQQGSLICFDALTGKERWRRESAIELGVNIKEKTYPGIVSIAVDDQDNVYAVGQRYIRNQDNSEYYGRIYKYDADGNRLEVFPVNENIDAWVSWISADDTGKHLVFGTANWDLGKTSKYKDNIYCLGEDIQSIKWSILINPVVPYQNTTMRKSPDISPDGGYIAGIASDGRCFFYDSNGHELWQRAVSQPQKVGGVYINATGLFVRFAGNYVAFTTGNTYNRANWQLPTPVEHPSSNSLFLFDFNGKLITKYKAGGMIEQIDVNKDNILLAVGRNIRTKDTKVHGLYIFSASKAEFIDFMPTEGPCVASAVSSDGKYIAGIEAPLQLDDGQVIGSYTLHLWHRLD